MAYAKLRASSAKSSGGFRSKSSGSCSAGCVNPKLAACSMSRGASTMAPVKPREYTRSPTIGCPGLRQVNANLVRAPAAPEPTPSQRRRPAQVAPAYCDMRHSPHAHPPLLRAPPQSVPSVFHQVRVERHRLFREAPIHQRKVLAIDVVLPEERGQMSLREPRAREHHQARGLLVDPVHHEERRIGGCLPAPVQKHAHPIDQCPALAFFVRHGGDARRLVDDHQMRVEMHDPANREARSRCVGDSLAAARASLTVTDLPRSNARAPALAGSPLPSSRDLSPSAIQPTATLHATCVPSRTMRAERRPVTAPDRSLVLTLEQA